MQSVNFLVVLINFRGIIHGAELRSAHGAESGGFVSFLGQRLVVHRASGLWIEGEFELLFPIELVAGIAQGIVAILRAGSMTSNVSGVRRDLIGDDPIL